MNVLGLECTPIDIEVDVSPGLPACIIVGLPDAAVSEARDRVRAAIKNSGLLFPRTRVTVNLAPAHIKKVGSLFDLPIAIGMLVATGVIHVAPQCCIVGELALNGDVRPVRGVLPLVRAAELAKQEVVIPFANSDEAALTAYGQITSVRSLKELVEHLNGVQSVQPLMQQRVGSIKWERQPVVYPVDFSDILGQSMAKRALEIAAAGGHNLVMSGPPGVGKSLLARALPSILPSLTQQQVIETTMVHSLCSAEPLVVRERPFRSPHHSAHTSAIIGGGPKMLPGEISLAHNGVLFFDELPEFRRDVLEALRQPLEDGSIRLHRAQGVVRYPAACVFVGAYNPCPCGGVEERCTCSAFDIERYRRKLSGPLLDRMDIKIAVKRVPVAQMHGVAQVVESSSDIRLRVEAAYARQMSRQEVPNARLTARQSGLLKMHPEAAALLQRAMADSEHSLRWYTKTRKVARTVADLSGAEVILAQHVAEALHYTAPSSLSGRAV